MTVPKAFYSLYAVARMLKIPKGTIDSAYKNGLDSIEAIKPIAHLFHEFVEGDDISYAIRKSHFDKWQKTGKVPKVSPGRPKSVSESDIHWNDPIPIELATAFKDVVDNANRLAPHNKITYKQARLIAYQEFIDRRPNLQSKN